MDRRASPRTLAVLSGALIVVAGIGWRTGAAFVAIVATLGAAALAGAVARSAVDRSDGREPAEGEDGSADGGGSIWDAIPAWQYDGRHVESGGLTREEQESAIAKIRQRAEELERDR